MKNTFYITTPIYYLSGRFHIGTVYTTVLADSLKRYKELRGFDAMLLTGADEHGQKIELLAKEKGKTCQAYVDEMAEQAKELWDKIGINYDDFIRTTEPRHESVVKAIWNKMMDNGDIYKGEYEGSYCIPCETYFPESQLVEGKCPECNREVKKMKEETYFFNMKKYAGRLAKHYEENPDFIAPESRRNELLNNFIKPGLEDLSITRTTIEWGIKVPNDPKHVIYVWLDALTNYITALGYMTEDDTLFKKYWPADIQIVGKDIIRFHGIYWPIFLMSLNLPLPKKIYAHGFIMMKDGKMSKSKGNVIYPEILIDRYGLDAVKYFLLKELSYGNDGIFTPENFVERFNYDLCNDLGNLLNRTVAMVNKYFEGKVPDYVGAVNPEDKELEDWSIKQLHNMEDNIESLHISVALSDLWTVISKTNKYIDDTQPWGLYKENKLAELSSAIYHLVENLRKIAVALKVFMPETSEKILEQLGLKDSNHTTWESLYYYKKYDEHIKVAEKGEPLFMRLDMEQEIEYIKTKMKG